MPKPPSGPIAPLVYKTIPDFFGKRIRGLSAAMIACGVLASATDAVALGDDRLENSNEHRAQAPSPAPAPGSARLLFSSGFEGTTALATPNSFYTVGAWQSLVGIDSLAGFAWPPNIWGGGLARFQMIAGAPVDLTTLGNYMVNQIQTVTGRNGNATRALYSELKLRGSGGTATIG